MFLTSSGEPGSPQPTADAAKHSKQADATPLETFDEPARGARTHPGPCKTRAWLRPLWTALREHGGVLPEILSEVSEWTWHFLRDAPFRPHEETITESLITDFTRRGHGAVRVYKASLGEEGDSGLDWAWAIETPSGWLHLLVQAKQVTGTALGRYDELRKHDADDKAGKLISATTNFQAVPVYAFYNGEVMPFGPEGTDVKFGTCGRPSVERQNADEGLPWEKGFSPMGITLAHAEDVRASVIVPPCTNQRAERVYRVSLPWSVCSVRTRSS